MVTPELKCPTTNLIPSLASLLATDTPSFGSARSSPTDGLFHAVLELRSKGRGAPGQRAGDAKLDLCLSGACENETGPQREAKCNQLLHRFPLEFFSPDAAEPARLDIALIEASVRQKVTRIPRRRQCRRFEVPTGPAASSSRNVKSKTG